MFYLVDYLEHGVVYLHGKLPDLIKEYLESKFSEIPELKYLVANSVILEGVNLPIDNLYILNTYNLHGKELTNLIGRVNRLNTIFAEGTPPDALNKLLPPVHFLNNDKYNKVDGSMTGKIQELRSRIFKDIIGNCTLNNYDINELKLDRKVKQNKLKRDQLTLRDEAVLTDSARTQKDRLRQYLIESGIAVFYTDVEIVLDKIMNNILYALRVNDFDPPLDFLEKINLIFISNCQEEISDYSFRRITYKSTREFYDFYIRVVQKRALKQNIKYLVQYYKREVLKGNTRHYFGESFGDEPSPFNPLSHRKEYRNLLNATNDDLVNLAIVKLKMEDDFVSFKLNKFIVMLHDYDLITTDEFNDLIYGTTDERKIEMTKMGMSISLIKRLQDDGLLSLLEFDSYGNLIATEEFNSRKSEMSDLYLFEVNRFLS